MAAVGAGDSLQVKPVDLSRGGSPAVRRDTAARRRHEYTLGGAPVARAVSCTLRGAGAAGLATRAGRGSPAPPARSDAGANLGG